MPGTGGVDGDTAIEKPPITPVSLESLPTKKRHFGSFRIKGRAAQAEAKVLDDGHVDVKIRHDTGLAHAFRTALHQQKLEIVDCSQNEPPQEFKNVPRMSIVVQIIGSRGDVQPFIALAKVLQAEPYNHRIRFCTHPIFKDFVEENGLEFWSLGGDPAQLMAYMVKNPGLVPGMESIRAGDIQRRRSEVRECLESAWESCISPWTGDGIAADRIGRGGAIGKTFIADAIIANPPTFAHIHCAEKLHIPVHLMFTMPWSPTQAFPHPLAKVSATNVDPSIANFLSYSLMELMTWQGLGDVINDFRDQVLKLEPISALWAGGLISRLQVPHTYCWSTALIPKPADWGSHITISGFYFLGLASDYKPPKDLMDFLEAGEPPIYVGFGSIVVDDPAALTAMIFEVVKRTGVRALVSKGWSAIGGVDPPEGVFLLGDCPHDWLFPRVKAVVHHGGAGTTAIGVTLGKPTVVVPFFGDQPFWGAMVARAGAGPDPIPYKKMTADSLTKSIEFALLPETLQKAKELATQIQNEDGTAEGARYFHQALGLDSMRCDLAPNRLAVWEVKKSKLKLSSFAARCVVKAGLLRINDMELVQNRNWNLEEGPSGPITGGIAAVVGTLTDIMLGIGHLSNQIVKVSAHELKNTHLPHHRSFSQTLAAKRLSTSSAPAPMPLVLEHNESQPLHVSGGSHTGDSDNSTRDLPVLSRQQTQKAQKRWYRAQNHKPMHLYSRRAITSAFPGFLYGNGNVDASIYLEHKHRVTLGARSKRGKRRDSSGIDTSPRVGYDMLRTTATVVRAIIQFPLKLTYNIASGCHNAPVVFLGDDTVRDHIRITGIPSGLHAAGREFVLGFYDGTTGLVTQPFNGARKEGGKGFIKGVGKGVGGLFLKTQAAIWALPGYTLKGIEKEMQNTRSSRIQKYIRMARGIQGLGDYAKASQEEIDAVIEAYKEHTSGWG